MNETISLRVVQLAVFNRSSADSVPDTKGTYFTFSTPLCSVDFPAQIHVIPQVTEALNITLLQLHNDTRTHLNTFSHEQDDSLHWRLPCLEFQWGQIHSSGFVLEASSEVSVYIDNKDDNYIVFPDDVNGRHYIVTTFQTMDLTESFILLQGNISNVKLTLPVDITANITINGSTYVGGEVVDITLPERGVVGVKCTCDLTGTTVVSDLPISLLVGATKGDRTDGVIEQLLPSFAMGRKFLYPVSAHFGPSVTLKCSGKIFGENSDPLEALGILSVNIAVSGLSLNTEISVTTKDRNIHTRFETNPVLSLSLLVRDFLSVEANTSLLCLLLHENIDNSNTRHMVLSILVPSELFHIRALFTFDTLDSVYTSFAITSTSFQYLAFNRSNINPFHRAMTYWRDYFITCDNSLSSPYIIKTNSENIVPFFGTVFRVSNTSAYEYILGMRLTAIYDACVKAPRDNGGNGDGVDNDCDNKIDEERFNHIDDDNDGLIDEDTIHFGVLKKSSGQSAWEYHETHKEQTSYSNSIIMIVISTSVALTSVVVFIGGMFLAEKIRRSGSTTRVTPIYLQHQHEPILQRY